MSITLDDNLKVILPDQFDNLFSADIEKIIFNFI